MTDSDRKKTPNFREILAQLRTVLPELKKQKVSLHEDLMTRPGRYLGDIARNGAVRFSAGNTAFAAYLGQIDGVDMGPGGAIAIQTAILAHSAVLQAAGTYNGSSPAASFRLQAIANFTTAGLLAGNATKDVVMGDMADASMMVLPVVTFTAWGKGHWDLANFLDRLTELKSQEGKSEQQIKQDIENDTLLKKFEKKYILDYGVADVVAPWKDMPVQEVANTFGKLFSDPAYLSNAQISSLVTMPFFLAGISKNALSKKFPFLKKVKSEALYAGGYGVGAVMSAANGDLLFGGAQALWALGYEAILNGDKAPSPISADEYAQLQEFMEDPQAVYKLFEESMRDLSREDAQKAWDTVSEQMLQVYSMIPAKAEEKKAEAFAILEILAAKAPQGANKARAGIQQLAKEGDALAVDKMERLGNLIGGSGAMNPPHPRKPQVQKAKSVLGQSGFGHAF